MTSEYERSGRKDAKDCLARRSGGRDAACLCRSMVDTSCEMADGAVLMPGVRDESEDSHAFVFLNGNRLQRQTEWPTSPPSRLCNCSSGFVRRHHGAKARRRPQCRRAAHRPHTLARRAAERPRCRDRIFDKKRRNGVHPPANAVPIRQGVDGSYGRLQALRLRDRGPLRRVLDAVHDSGGCRALFCVPQLLMLGMDLA